MNSIEANLRVTKTKGDLNSLRAKGEIPAVVYGGKEKNQNISFSKKILKTFIDKENFLSNIINIKIEGKDLNVLPREVVFDTVTDEPIHVDFLRIVKGGKVKLEIPVKFINSEITFSVSIFLVNLFKFLRILVSDKLSKALVASSNKSILGFLTMALAIAIFCLCPPESLSPLSPTIVL